LPGVLQPTEDSENRLQRARPIVIRLADVACDRLIAMRQREGAALAEDLLAQVGAIRQRLGVVRERAPRVAEDYHQRLRSRMDELLARAQLSVSEQDLIREVAIFAERSDIAEEINRLTGHLTQFEQIIRDEQGEPSGRTLDFISQELLREANTIASKCSDVAISRAIVEVKGFIDRIKEQVQNAE
jgi:uncharacterized protein (TIGR00255 family)